MSLRELFEAAVVELRRRRIAFALAGGLAADLYRAEPRLTMDVDLALATARQEDAARTGSEILRGLGLEAGVLRGGPLFAIKSRRTKPVMLVGRVKGGKDEPGLDLLLPSLPWTGTAIVRAEGNLVDFGFGPVPVLRLEDVIVSKLYALQGSEVRAKDLDDLQSIYAAGHVVDRAYLAGRIGEFGLRVPASVKVLVPEELRKLCGGRGRGSEGVGGV
ncbi:MAG TPA: nucleotidyl transferase AbiEii/AbiGii toxin family protein [Kiritimatiellia bacterium]|nr:nucleotidyl transferase AbiEii/AbiGii toxin family protein [Kiritimatiellia bacterium]